MKLQWFFKRIHYSLELLKKTLCGVMKMLQMLKLKQQQHHACVDEFIDRLPGRYDMHLNKVELMYLVDKNKDFV